MAVSQPKSEYIGEDRVGRVRQKTGTPQMFGAATQQVPRRGVESIVEVRTDLTVVGSILGIRCIASRWPSLFLAPTPGIRGEVCVHKMIRLIAHDAPHLISHVCGLGRGYAEDTVCRPCRGEGGLLGRLVFQTDGL